MLAILTDNSWWREQNIMILFRNFLLNNCIYVPAPANVLDYLLCK